MRPPFAGHVPGALSIALRGSFASWLGWLVAADRPLVFVLDDGQDRGERVRQALKIGYESLVGELAGGMAAWRASGRAEARTELVRDPAALRGPVRDVRQTGEYVGGHVPGATLLELGSLPAQAADVASGAVTVMCGHGERAATAASLLERAGGRSAVFVGGAGDWSRALARAVDKIDLVGPARRGLAMGLNEAAGRRAREEAAAWRLTPSATSRLVLAAPHSGRFPSSIGARCSYSPQG